MVVLDSLEEIKKSIGFGTNGPAQRFLVATCQRYMDKYVPMDLGLLRTIIYMDSDGITYMSPYASYQYYGERRDGSYKITHHTTPGTGPYWDQRMLSANKNDVIKEVQNFIERRM